MKTATLPFTNLDASTLREIARERLDRRMVRDADTEKPYQEVYSDHLDIEVTINCELANCFIVEGSWMDDQPGFLLTLCKVTYDYAKRTAILSYGVDQVI